MTGRMMHCFAIIFAVLFCSQLITVSKAQTVLTINGQGMDGRFKADFNVSMFDKFYTCLSDGLSTSCTSTSNDEGRVIKVEKCSGSSSTNGNYICQASEDIVCTKSDRLVEQDTCKPQSIVNTNFRSFVSLEWNGNQHVETKSFSDDISVRTECNGSCNYLEATYPVSPRQTSQTTRAPTPISRITQPGSTTIRQDGATDSIAKDDDNDNNDMAIIIGAAVGGAVFVVIVVTIIIIIVLRRRKQKASSSLTTTTTTTTTTATTTTTTTNKDDYTDICPYTDSSLSNVGPNLTFNNQNSNPNDPPPVTYATVDPTKKLNKKKTSLGTNNVNDNKEDNSKDNKTQLRPNLGYTEVDINNGVDFPQSSSVANKGQSSSQVLPPSPPDPSVKPKYYNTFGETGEDPRAAYAQVVKKSKDKSAVKGKGAGFNPPRGPSGYEEAVPHTDTQYAEVDLSAKTKPKLNPAPGGVYAKLHDPVRKITDVYNECPVADNAGE